MGTKRASSDQVPFDARDGIAPREVDMIDMTQKDPTSNEGFKSADRIGG